MEERKTITSMMEENRVFNPPHELSEKAYIKIFLSWLEKRDTSG